jgi:pimeloyl-ACP methyl ester carboxylesterase
VIAQALEIDDLRLTYEWAGEGPPLVLLHGHLSHHDTRRPMAAAARIRQTGLCEVNSSASSGAIPDAGEEDR